VSEARSPRRRRSVAVAPALLDPAELPEDAAGRVALIRVEAPDDIVGAPPVAYPPPAPASTPVVANATAWIAVGIAGIAIIAIFVVGMLLTH
jgi:hypothetical protein